MALRLAQCEGFSWTAKKVTKVFSEGQCRVGAMLCYYVSRVYPVREVPNV